MDDRTIVKSVADHFDVSEFAIFVRAFRFHFFLSGKDTEDEEEVEPAYAEYVNTGKAPYWVMYYCTNLIPKNNNKPKGLWCALLDWMGGGNEN